MTEIIYSTERHPLAEGRVFRNPRHFHTVESGATKVFIVGDYPKIAAAYRKSGVPVEQVGQNAPAVAPLPEVAAPPLPDDFELPDDWRDLPWQELRSLARRCGAPFAINSTQAIEAIEEWLLKERIDEVVDDTSQIAPE